MCSFDIIYVYLGLDPSGREANGESSLRAGATEIQAFSMEWLDLEFGTFLV